MTLGKTLHFAPIIQRFSLSGKGQRLSAFSVRRWAERGNQVFGLALSVGPRGFIDGVAEFLRVLLSVVKFASDDSFCFPVCAIPCSARERCGR